MIRYLIRQCPFCKGTIKIQVEDGKIISIENGRQARIGPWKYGDSNTLSHKTIQCLNNVEPRGQWDRDLRCRRYMYVRSFKEITL